MQWDAKVSSLPRRRNCSKGNFDGISVTSSEICIGMKCSRVNGLKHANKSLQSKREPIQGWNNREWTWLWAIFLLAGSINQISRRRMTFCSCLRANFQHRIQPNSLRRTPESRVPLVIEIRIVSKLINYRPWFMALDFRVHKISCKFQAFHLFSCVLIRARITRCFVTSLKRTLREAWLSRSPFIHSNSWKSFSLFLSIRLCSFS